MEAEAAADMDLTVTMTITIFLEDNLLDLTKGYICIRGVEGGGV